MWASSPRRGVLVQLRVLGLGGQEVVDQLAPPTGVGQVEVEPAVEAPGAQQGRVEDLGPVGGRDHQDVVVAGGPLGQLGGGRQPAVQPVDQPAGGPLGQRRGVEALELDEQLVDDPAGARGDGAVAAAVQAAPAAADGVDLLDDADGPALLAGRPAQRLEVGAELAGGHAVPHGLEAGRRHEQERHPGVAGHRLGHVGLAGARLALEQDAPARVVAQPVLEGGVAEEQVERPGDLVAQGAQALHVVEADVDLLGPPGQVGRASLAEHGQEHDHGDDDHDQQGRQPDHGVGAEVQAVQRVERPPGQDAPPGGQGGHPEDGGQPGQAPLAAPLPGPAHVDVGRPQHHVAAEHGAGAARSGRGQPPAPSWPRPDRPLHARPPPAPGRHPRPPPVGPVSHAAVPPTMAAGTVQRCSRLQLDGQPRHGCRDRPPPARRSRRPPRRPGPT
jgi:hypothetical protein